MPNVKKPPLEKVEDPSLVEFYKAFGERMVEEGTITAGYRYDQISGRKMRHSDEWVKEAQKKNPDAKPEYSHNVAISNPSSEVFTLMKKGESWFVVLGLQPRSPYFVEVEGQRYIKFLWEQAAGLLEEGESFVEAAVRETQEEFGAAALKYLGFLRRPNIFRQTSFVNEVSQIFLAVVECLDEQHLDENENIRIKAFPLDEFVMEYMAYMSGKKDSFYGFDINHMTISSIDRFLYLLETKQIDLEDLKGNLLEK